MRTFACGWANSDALRPMCCSSDGLQTGKECDEGECLDVSCYIDRHTSKYFAGVSAKKDIYQLSVHMLTGSKLMAGCVCSMPVGPMQNQVNSVPLLNMRKGHKQFHLSASTVNFTARHQIAAALILWWNPTQCPLQRSTTYRSTESSNR